MFSKKIIFIFIFLDFLLFFPPEVDLVDFIWTPRDYTQDFWG